MKTREDAYADLEISKFEPNEQEKKRTSLQVGLPRSPTANDI